ncbi:MAG: DUF302 domain-containing protein [Acidobacteriota bacterium]|nr:DUF302 domain-containing protein [Acidobacteriota bacterium]
MGNKLGFEVELPMAFDDAIPLVKDALKQEGFGVLTEIDLRAAFKEKLGKDFRPYVILGACNPPLAYAAVTADPSIGLLLPCNVTVESTGEGRSMVRLTDPEQLLGGVAAGMAPHMVEVAKDARVRMVRATDALKRISAA